MYERVVQARQLLSRYDHVAALPLLKNAVAVEPGYGSAHAWLSVGYIIRYFDDLNEENVQAAIDSGRRAVLADESDSFCHASFACALVFNYEFELAGQHFRRAIEINPSDAMSLLLSANWWLRISQPLKALEVLDTVQKLDPYPPTWYWETRTNTLMMLKRYDEAISAINRFQPQQYWHHAYKAICLVNSGFHDQARTAVAELRRLTPNITAKSLIDGEPYQDATYKEFLVDSLRRAGLVDITPPHAGQVGT